MKTFKIFGILALIISATLLSTVSCSAERATAVGQKSGAQLWGENCVRCHSIPSPSSYNDTDWDTIGLHMKVRANMTESEMDKVLEFLKSAN